MKLLLTSLLLLGACVAPSANSNQAQTGISGGSVKAPVIPATYEAWLDTLANQEHEASQPFQAGFTGKILVQLPSEDVNIEVQMSGSSEYADVRHFRQIIDLRVDLGDLPGDMQIGPINVRLHVNADGESMHFAPGFNDDWLLQTIKQTNMGFEKMVFTLDLDILEEMLSV